MKFLCLTMWLGKLYTDNDADTNDDYDSGGWTKHNCIRLFG